jgi:pimeloyl-ACP methyl ester carboxylesterase
VKRILAAQDGPSVLVGHSYGGAVITEAGNNSSVVGLVYIAAHMLDSGEKESEAGKRFPERLAKSGAIEKTPDGFTHMDPAEFHELFAADLPGDQGRIDGTLPGAKPCGQFLSDDHHGGLENQTELEARRRTEPSTQTRSAGMPNGL